MDTTIETLMRQYAETIDSIKVWEGSLVRLTNEIDILTRKIRPEKWLNKIDVNSEMFHLYTKKLELIAEYDKDVERLNRLKLTEALQLSLIEGREFRL